MKYCPRCKHLSFSESEKCECGGKFVKNIDYDAPVHVITAEGGDRLRVKRALSKADLPFSELDISGYSPSIGNVGDKADYLVPIGLVEEAIEALCDAELMSKPDWFKKIEVPDDYVWREMSERRRITVRILSIVVLLGLIWACVAGVDLLVDMFENAL